LEDGRRVAVWELADMFQLGVATVHEIQTSKLNMSQIEMLLYFTFITEVDNECRYRPHIEMILVSSFLFYSLSNVYFHNGTSNNPQYFISRSKNELPAVVSFFVYIKKIQYAS
jgi:hypothetical protein